MGITPLFIVGHKRSGTTLMAKLLNTISQVFVSSESDTLWILYQNFHNVVYRNYPYDGPYAMQKNLSHYEHLIKKEKSVWENYISIQQRIMLDGFIHLEPMNKTSLSYIGDQKPFQNADPQIVDFVEQHFPQPRYLHIIRHPSMVLNSCRNFGPNSDGGWMWKTLPDEEILSRWTIVEKWILQLKERFPKLILDLRYEDLTRSPQQEIKRIYSFLNLPVLNETLNQGIRMIESNKKEIIKRKFSKETLRIMSLYGYVSSGVV